MQVTRISDRSPYDENGRIDFAMLGQALHLCSDLPLLQENALTNLSGLVDGHQEKFRSLELARKLRKELIASAEQITRYKRRPSIREIITAIEEARLHSETKHLVQIKKKLGIPFSRDRLDLARYFAIRLLMEGLSNDTIAGFLEVEIRTLGNYIYEAKERIRIIMESRLS